MNTQYPDRISVEQTAEREVLPLWAVMSIVIEGESSVFGSEALRKSKEIARFVDELETLGYVAENVSLENIAIQASTGKLLKASMAKYTMRLANISLALLPKILGAVAAQKNIAITDLHYDYGSLDADKAALLATTCLKAKQQGAEVCAAFGVPMLGVYSLTPKWIHPTDAALAPIAAHNSGYMLSKSRSPSQDSLEGLEFSTSHKGRLILMLNVEFRVGEFE